MRHLEGAEREEIEREDALKRKQALRAEAWRDEN